MTWRNNVAKLLPLHLLGVLHLDLFDIGCCFRFGADGATQFDTIS